MAQYQIKKNSSKPVAHMWDAESKDTVCRMWSTGGLRKKKYALSNELGGASICKNCKRNAEQSGYTPLDTVVDDNEIYRQGFLDGFEAGRRENNGKI